MDDPRANKSSVDRTKLPGAITISDPPKGYHVDSMDKTAWNQRYANSDLVWSAAPNIWVEQLTQDLPPGTALDIAAGEGRNALWLAARGWHATAVDFSVTALQRAASLAEEQLGRDAGRLVTLEADVETWVPPARSYDLVLVVYLHLHGQQRSAIMLSAAEAVAGRNTAGRGTRPGQPDLRTRRATGPCGVVPPQ